MFEFVRKHNKLLQVVLFLLIFPSFVLFGIQGYNHFTGDGNLAAKVDGIPISREQLDAAERDQVARMQQALGGNADAAALDTPQMRMRTLDAMVREALLQVAVNKQHLQVDDSALQQAILQIPQVAALRNKDGTFDVAAFRKLIQEQGMTTGQFEASVRAQLLLQQAQGGLADNALGSRAVAAQLIDWRTQTRSVRLARFQAADYEKDLNPDAAQVQAYYQAHPEQFRVPEKATIQYVVFSAAQLQAGVQITPQQEQAYYDAHKSEFNSPEQRRASHILITLPPQPTPAQVAQAQAKAEAIAAQLRKDPTEFAQLARKDSQDPGTSASGGDLGWFTPDAMVKPVAEAVFALHKVGQIAGPVRSQFGFHVVELTGIRPAETKTLAQARPEIDAALRKQQATKLFHDSSDKFSSMVYEDSRSYDKVAAKLHLQVQTATDVTEQPRSGDPSTDPLASPAFVKALFGKLSVRDRRNIPSVQIAPDVLASGRIVSLQPATTLSFAQAQDRARQMLVQQMAAQRAIQAGEQALAQARAGKAQPQWGPTQQLSLAQSQSSTVPQSVLEAVFRANPDKLPQLLGVQLPGQGYALVSVDSVTHAKPSAEELAAQRATLNQILGQAYEQAYVDSLKKEYGVKIFYKPNQSTSG
jgi:peptidyl-prolyl cis-trans isomerase D